MWWTVAVQQLNAHAWGKMDYNRQYVVGPVVVTCACQAVVPGSNSTDINAYFKISSFYQNRCF